MSVASRADRFGPFALCLLCGSVWSAQSLALPISGTINVRQISANAAGVADPNLAQDIQFANAVYNQIGISVVQSSTATIKSQDVYDDRTTATPASQVTGAGGLLTQSRGAANEMDVYYVNQYISSSGSSPPGQAWSDEDARGGSAAATGLIMPPVAGQTVVRFNDTVAHETYHELVDRWRFRTFDSVGGDTPAAVHSQNPNWIMTASNTPRNIPNNVNQVWPAGNSDQIPATVIGSLGTSGATNSAVRQPLITAMYSNSGGGPAPRADGGAVNTNLVSNIQRSNTQLFLNQNNSTMVTPSFGWGQTQQLTLPEALGQGNRTYSIDETAQRAKNSQETLSYFITSPSVLSAGGSLLQGWGFGSTGVQSLDNTYTGVAAGSVTVTLWSDILYDGQTPGSPITPANGGAGVVLDPSQYSFTSTTNAFGSVSFQLNVPSANSFDLAGYRDIQISFNVNTVPPPAGLVLMALPGLTLVSRRRRS